MMEISIKSNEIVEELNTPLGDSGCCSKIYIFDSNSIEVYRNVIEKLRNEKFDLIDVDKVAEIHPEDYNISLKDMGYSDSEGYAVKDILWDDETKRARIVRYKVEKCFSDNITRERAVYVVTYNNMYLTEYKGGNNFLYELIRSYMKDGYNDTPISALVFADTKERLRDFCPNGIRVK